MKRKYKTTGCAKFILMLVILAPLAYLGASYFNGQDGIQNIRDLFGGNGDRTQVVESRDTDDLTDQIKDLREEVKALEKENDRLKSDLEACQSAGSE